MFVGREVEASVSLCSFINDLITEEIVSVMDLLPLRPLSHSDHSISGCCYLLLKCN